MVLFDSREFQTLFLYTIALILFYLVPQAYDRVSYQNITAIKKKAFWYDKRMFFLSAIYALIFGFRYDYMLDWSNYVRYYEYIQAGGINDGWREPGFYAYVKILCSLGLNYYSMFVIECFVWVFSICYLFKDHKHYLWIVLPLIFLRTLEAMVISRQYFAMSFLYMAYKNYFKGSWFCAVLLAGTAFSLHFSVILWLFFFLIMRKIENLSAKCIILFFIVITLCSTVFSNYLISFGSILSIYLNGNGMGSNIYDSDFLTDNAGTGASLRQVITLSMARGAYIWLYYKFRNNNLIEDKYINNLLIIGLTGMLIGIVCGYNMIFSRFATYVTIFYNIGWGILFYIAIKNKRSSGILYLCVALLVLIYLIGGFYSSLISTFEMKDVTPFLIYEF